jgi:hypothetical protein
MKQNRIYLLFTLLLLLAEVMIAAFFHDGLIRPYGGDFLVVILLYCYLKTLRPLPPLKAGIIVLLFAYAVETAQYFHLATLPGLQHSKVAVLLMGNSFSVTDLLMYTAGIAFVLVIEKVAFHFKNNRHAAFCE